MKLSTSLLLTGLIVLNTNVIAQKDTASTDLFDMSFEKLLEQAVSTASKRAEKINKTPNVMHLITKQQINSRGYRNLRDVLSDIPGFNVLHKDLQYVSQIRGIAPNDNEKVSLMINGVIISSVTEDNYLTNLINMDNISKIEIIIGPGSVLYGSKSLCAIINLITNETEKTEVTVGVGNYNHNAVTLSKGAKFEDGNFFVSSTRVQSNGWNALRNAPSSTGFDLLKGTDLLGKLYPSYSLFGKANFRNWEIQFSSLNSSTPELDVHKSGSYVKGNRDENKTI